MRRWEGKMNQARQIHERGLLPKGDELWLLYEDAIECLLSSNVHKAKRGEE